MKTILQSEFLPDPPGLASSLTISNDKHLHRSSFTFLTNPISFNESNRMSKIMHVLSSWQGQCQWRAEKQTDNEATSDKNGWLFGFLEKRYRCLEMEHHLLRLKRRE